MKDKNLYHPNDKLFKAIFSKRAAVIAYLKYFLPKHLSTKLDIQLLFFIINRTDIPLERISALASETSNEPLKRNLMTTYEQILAQGEARGEARGATLKTIRAILNMHKENFSAKMIASIQEVTEDFVKDVIAGNIKEEDYGRVQKF